MSIRKERNLFKKRKRKVDWVDARAMIDGVHAHGFHVHVFLESSTRRARKSTRDINPIDGPPISSSSSSSSCFGLVWSLLHVSECGAETLHRCSSRPTTRTMFVDFPRARAIVTCGTWARNPFFGSHSRSKWTRPKHNSLMHSTWVFVFHRARRNIWVFDTHNSWAISLITKTT